MATNVLGARPPLGLFESGLYRSEQMEYLKIMVPKDSAKVALHRLGEVQKTSSRMSSVSLPCANHPSCDASHPSCVSARYMFSFDRLDACI